MNFTIYKRTSAPKTSRDWESLPPKLGDYDVKTIEIAIKTCIPTEAYGYYITLKSDTEPKYEHKSNAGGIILEIVFKKDEKEKMLNVVNKLFSCIGTKRSPSAFNIVSIEYKDEKIKLKIWTSDKGEYCEEVKIITGLAFVEKLHDGTLFNRKKNAKRYFNGPRFLNVSPAKYRHYRPVPMNPEYEYKKF